MGTGPKLIGLMGPTGSGKSTLAEALAERLDAQLINADAFQVYRGFDIGTNKSPSRDCYALIDIKSPDESYGVGEFVLDATEVLQECWERGRNAIVVGGTGLYVRALFEEYQDLLPSPTRELRAELSQLSLTELLSQLDKKEPGHHVDRANRSRVQRALEKLLSPQTPIAFELPPFARIKLGLDVEPEILNPALELRTRHLLSSGWIEEVQTLLTNGVSEESAAFRAIGYSEISRYLGDVFDFEELVVQIQTQTRQYAKRQRAWMRSEPHLTLLKRDIFVPPTVSEVESILNRINEEERGLNKNGQDH